MVGNDGFTKLLIHSADEVDGLTSFVDSSASAHVMSPGTGVTHSTNYAKFGTSAIKMTGAGPLSAADSPDFILGDTYTFDAWYRLDSISTHMPFWGQVLSNSSRIQLYGAPGGSTLLYGVNGSVFCQVSWDLSSLPLNVFFHLEIGIAPGVAYLFINGFLQAATIVIGPGSVPDLSASFSIGYGRAGSVNRYLNGYIDEPRLSVGIVRHTANFTPPTAPYSGETITTTYEQAYSFNVSRLDEQLKSFIVGPALVREQTKLFIVAPATLYESAVYFDVARSIEHHQQKSFTVAAYKASEQAYSFLVRASSGLHEQASSFNVDIAGNDVYEQAKGFIVGVNGDIPTVTAGISVVIGGSAMRVISLTGGRNGYYNLFDVVVLDDQLARSLAYGSTAYITWHSAHLIGFSEIPIIDDTISLFLSTKSQNKTATQEGDTKTITLRCLSVTAGLDALPAPVTGALPVDTIWPAGTLASVILGDLCPLQVDFDLQSTDFIIGQEFDGSGRHPIEIINELFDGQQGQLSIGAADDGTLTIKRKLPVLCEDLLSGNFTPDWDLQPSDYLITSSSSPPDTKLYNMLTATTVALADSVDLRSPVIIEDPLDSTKAIVYGYKVPWDCNFNLITCHTGCSDITITASAMEIVEAPPEEIDFEDGIGVFSLPIFELIAVDWECNKSLGIVTPSSDGTLTAAVKEWSFASVTCKVQRLKFVVTDYNKHTIKLRFEAS